MWREIESQMMPNTIGKQKSETDHGAKKLLEMWGEIGLPNWETVESKRTGCRTEECAGEKIDRKTDVVGL